MKTAPLLKHYLLLQVLTLLAAGTGPVLAEGTPPQTSTNTAPAFVFPMGEELLYRIYWGYIPVGQTQILIDRIEDNVRPLIAIRYKTKTNRFFDAIYPVDDEAESLVEPATFLPVRFSFTLRRRGSTTDKIVTFDHSRLIAQMVEKDTGISTNITIAPDTRDLISFLYHSRSMTLRPYQTRKCTFIADSGLLDMKLKTYDYEKVDLETFGRVQGLKMEPIAKLDKMLVEDGKVMSWIAQERCVATKMTIRAPLADVSIELCAINGPGNDFWSRIMRQKPVAKDCESLSATAAQERKQP